MKCYYVRNLMKIGFLSVDMPPSIKLTKHKMDQLCLRQMPKSSILCNTKCQEKSGTLSFFFSRIWKFYLIISIKRARETKFHHPNQFAMAELHFLSSRVACPSVHLLWPRLPRLPEAWDPYEREEVREVKVTSLQTHEPLHITWWVVRSQTDNIAPCKAQSLWLASG